jgi:hypothetical protein
MPMNALRFALVLAAISVIGACRSTQNEGLSASAQVRQQGDTAASAPTKLEAFKPAAGSVLTVGYNELGEIGGVSIHAKELRDTKAGIARGLVVEVTESQYRKERSFVDVDELPELLKGADAVLAVKSNPTWFEQFEVRYRTRGDLQLVAFNNSRGMVSYALEVGRISNASAFLSEAEMHQVRAMSEAGMKLLGAP